MALTGRGGGGRGQGRKKSPYTERFGLRVTPENKEFLDNTGNGSKFINDMLDRIRADEQKKT